MLNPKEEAHLIQTINYLIVLTDDADASKTSLIQSFHGTVFRDVPLEENFVGKIVYLMGEISRIKNERGRKKLEEARRVFVIRDLSNGYNDEDWHVIGEGRVPLNIHGLGVFYPRFFDSSSQYFHRIESEHKFQHLTESNKPGAAYRTGVYLTPVEQVNDEELRFNLLRCSSNFTGPTLNFKETDQRIVGALNEEAAGLFENAAPLNHVLAQIYHNSPATENGKAYKAKIKSHSDKTKDMPRNGIMAFCTFYKELEKLEQMENRDRYDYGCKSMSGLTKIQFCLKKCVKERGERSYVDKFNITLYPESVFFIPLSTNRLYTHEIKPSCLDAQKLPTRMGYVVRCSKTKAAFRNQKVYLKLETKNLVKLQPPSEEGMAQLRQLYKSENDSDDFIDYGDRFLFSMNQGDYLKPEFSVNDRFQSYPIDILNRRNSYEELSASITWEYVGKGRKGAVLVQPLSNRGNPIVRTTTKYENPAQIFQPIHTNLAQMIETSCDLSCTLNNALVERYTNQYSNMGFHSDQALDLAEGSHIAVFSAYKNPEVPNRKLIIERKERSASSEETCEIPLGHNRVIVFSLDTNRLFRHKIILDRTATGECSDNEWLGFTFRTSKTHVTTHKDGTAWLEHGNHPLQVITDEKQRRTFFQWRSRENQEVDFDYPSADFSGTISPSDLMDPVALKISNVPRNCDY